MSLILKHDFCLQSIIEYIDLKQLIVLYFSILNHEFKDNINSYIRYIKRNNIIYKKLLKDKIPINEIETLPIKFFELNELLRNYKNFKNYIFGVFEKLKYTENMIFFANCRYELYFIKKVDENTIIMLHNINKNTGIYFSIFEKKINIKNETKYGKNYCGYLIYNNTPVKENLHIMNHI
jgi:hypothetical protein